MDNVLAAVLRHFVVRRHVDYGRMRSASVRPPDKPARVIPGHAEPDSQTVMSMTARA